MATNSLALDNFNRNIFAVEDLMRIYQLVSREYPLLNEQTDEILRAAIVLSVSALDNFFHDYYRTEIVEAYLGQGTFNVKFEKIRISIQGLQDMDNTFSEAEKRNYLTLELRKMQKTDTYQSQRSIENLFSNVGVTNIWSKLEVLIGINANTIKQELGIIIDRRNKISHESDWDFINSQKIPIDIGQVEDVIVFIKKLIVDGVNNITP
jgi:hypothetical protein